MDEESLIHVMDFKAIHVQGIFSSHVWLDEGIFWRIPSSLVWVVGEKYSITTFTRRETKMYETSFEIQNLSNQRKVSRLKGYIWQRQPEWWNSIYNGYP